MRLNTAVLGFFIKCLRVLAAPFFWIRSCLPSKKLPAPTNELLQLSATKLAERIRKKEISSFNIVQAYIERIQQVNPLLNAVVEDRFADALEDARNADLEVAAAASVEQLAADRPLLGVPITVKESCSVSGMKLSGGSYPRKEMVATCDGGAVANLRKAGAIILCVTNTPEYCLCCETYNHVTGKTSNPYDLRRSPAGSSGGEAALLGCGASCVGVGSDLAGSVRIPAMWCGTFGHKPTPGTIPISGHFPISPDPDFQQYLCIGPLVRYAEDLAPMVHIMAGDKASDLYLKEKVNISKLNIFYMKDSGDKKLCIPVQREISAAVDMAANYLKDKCANVKEITIPEFENSFIYSLILIIGAPQVPDVLQDYDNPENSKNIYLESLKFIFRLSNYSGPGLAFSWLVKFNSLISPATLQSNKDAVAKLRKKLTDILGEDGVMLYPTFPVSAVLHYESYIKLVGAIYSVIFNVLGLPSTNVPMGRDNKGLPIGIQVVGAPNQDRLCIAVAEELEKGFGGWIPPIYNTTT